MYRERKLREVGEEIVPALEGKHGHYSGQFLIVYPVFISHLLLTSTQHMVWGSQPCSWDTNCVIWGGRDATPGVGILHSADPIGPEAHTEFSVIAAELM